MCNKLIISVSQHGSCSHRPSAGGSRMLGHAGRIAVYCARAFSAFRTGSVTMRCRGRHCSAWPAAAVRPSPASAAARPLFFCHAPCPLQVMEWIVGYQETLSGLGMEDEDIRFPGGRGVVVPYYLCPRRRLVQACGAMRAGRRARLCVCVHSLLAQLSSTPLVGRACFVRPLLAVAGWCGVDAAAAGGGAQEP